MNGVQFDDLRWLNLGWAALAVAVLGALAIWLRRRALRRFADARLLPRLAAPAGLLRPIVRLALVVGALLLLVAALIGPRWGESEERFLTRGIDVMVVLDVSRSMQAQDLAPNRLARAKLAISDDLLPALAGDRVGLLAFAGATSLKCPLTHDYGFFRLALDDISTSSAPRGGTLIGDALRKAGECFDTKLDNHRVILLITDGEDQDSYPVEAARALWADRKIPVIAIALGDEREGARIPTDSGYLKYQGRDVRSRADFAQLREIASASETGAFVPVGTRNFDLAEIYRSLVAAKVRAREKLEAEYVPLPAKSHPFAAAALALILIESFLRDGTRRAVSRDSLYTREQAA